MRYAARGSKVLVCLVLVLTLTVTLSSCGHDTAPQIACPAPNIVDYNQEFNDNLADQIDRVCGSGENRELCQALRDAYVVRRKIKACN
jgi:hypothetical protein